MVEKFKKIIHDSVWALLVASVVSSVITVAVQKFADMPASFMAQAKIYADANAEEVRTFAIAQAREVRTYADSRARDVEIAQERRSAELQAAIVGMTEQVKMLNKNVEGCTARIDRIVERRK